MRLSHKQQIQELILPPSCNPPMQSTRLSGSKKVNRLNQWIHLRLQKFTLYQTLHRFHWGATPLHNKRRTIPCQELKVHVLLFFDTKNSFATCFWHFELQFPMLDTSNSFERRPHQHQGPSRYTMSSFASQLNEGSRTQRKVETFRSMAFLQQFQDVVEDFSQ